MPLNYYNEIDPFAAQWLRNLIDAELIPYGVVDTRDIRDVQPSDLAGFTQCHFFAGIGGWPYALSLAGVPASMPLWTGSCPCQPFSAAGKREGFTDDRHLWPDWFRLIRQCKPAIIFGEQVASPDGLRWFDLVSTDLEDAGYAVGAADLCAASVGAPHIRQRLWFVADRVSARLEERQEQPAWQECATIERSGDAGGLGQPDSKGPFARREAAASMGRGNPAFAASRNPWAELEWLPCIDGKWRPTQPGLFPLASGVPARVGRLRAYGNAIVPQVAAEFIRNYLLTVRHHVGIV